MGEKITTKEEFEKEANEYWQYYNFQRGHSGIGMKGRTPYEVIKESRLINPERLMTFPVLILEENISTLRKCTNLLLLRSEVTEYQQRHPKKKIDQKMIIDLKEKYSFFDHHAQKVLTEHQYDFC